MLHRSSTIHFLCFYVEHHNLCNTYSILLRVANTITLCHEPYTIVLCIIFHPKPDRFYTTTLTIMRLLIFLLSTKNQCFKAVNYYTATTVLQNMLCADRLKIKNTEDRQNEVAEKCQYWKNTAKKNESTCK